MGKTFENLTWDDLCDLMCGKPEEDYEDEEVKENGSKTRFSDKGTEQKSE